MGDRVTNRVTNRCVNNTENILKRKKRQNPKSIRMTSWSSCGSCSEHCRGPCRVRNVLTSEEDMQLDVHRSSWEVSPAAEDLTAVAGWMNGSGPGSADDRAVPQMMESVMVILVCLGTQNHWGTYFWASSKKHLGLPENWLSSKLHTTFKCFVLVILITTCLQAMVL